MSRKPLKYCFLKTVIEIEVKAGGRGGERIERDGKTISERLRKTVRQSLIPRDGKKSVTDSYLRMDFLLLSRFYF